MKNLFFLFFLLSSAAHAYTWEARCVGAEVYHDGEAITYFQSDEWDADFIDDEGGSLRQYVRECLASGGEVEEITSPDTDSEYENMGDDTVIYSSEHDLDLACYYTGQCALSAQSRAQLERAEFNYGIKRGVTVYTQDSVVEVE